MNEDAYLIKGNKILKGEVRLSGAKNVALKIIIASLLLDQEVILNNVPNIGDVNELLNLISSLGGKARFIADKTVVIDGRSININKVDLLFASRIRVSFMLFAPLLYKFSDCYIPNPGGCRIGARPIDRIIDGMNALGIKVSYNSQTGYYWAKMTKKPSGKYRFAKPTHTGTELLLMLSVLGKDITTLENIALEPEIDELINFFNLSGARITKNKNRMTIYPTSKLLIDKPFSIISDRNEAVTYACLSLATKGSIEISPLDPNSIDSFLTKLKSIGVLVEKKSQDKIKISFKSTFKSSKVETSPHPGFMTDWQPSWAMLMTQAEGISVISERVFENRFSYVDELRKLGARIDFIKLPTNIAKDYFFFNFNPSKKYNQAIRIYGTQKLHGGVLNIADLRAGATLATAALVAEGESIVNGASMLERGFVHLEFI
ncbi:MAG: UDP-N-acetylglucosamine 1-carboxyvinyltransferase [Actinobacteria bacterium]|nr:UDP-N-acetylglucosamine 1-carboxyvinyltransferase [Actinomycetota bacterium]